MHATRRGLRSAAIALALGLAADPSRSASRSSGSFFAAAQSSSSSDASETSIIQTHNYIDTISGYDELSTCAELVLSTVVRGEYSGCADTFAVTSYTCFVSSLPLHVAYLLGHDQSHGEVRRIVSLILPLASCRTTIFSPWCPSLSLHRKSFVASHIAPSRRLHVNTNTYH